MWIPTSGLTLRLPGRPPRPRGPGQGSDLSEGRASSPRGSLPGSAHPGAHGGRRTIQEGPSGWRERGKTRKQMAETPEGRCPGRAVKVGVAGTTPHDAVLTHFDYGACACRDGEEVSSPCGLPPQSRTCLTVRKTTDRSAEGHPTKHPTCPQNRRGRGKSGESDSGRAHRSRGHETTKCGRAPGTGRQEDRNSE